MDRQTLSIMKACEVVGVSRRTIYNWISAGKVEYVRTAGGRSESSPTRCGAMRGPGATSADGGRRSRPGARRVNLSSRERSAGPARVAGRGRSARAVPPAEQSARDHPGARRAARSQGRRTRQPRARGAGRVERARRHGHRARNSQHDRTRRRLTVPERNSHRTAARGVPVQPRISTPKFCNRPRQDSGAPTAQIANP